MSLEKTKNPHAVIIKPVVSEKAYNLIDHGQYTFVVAPDANKVEIKMAIEEIFKVKVASVNTQNREGKRVRTRSGWGKRNDTKRAIVTLKEGSIDVFGMQA